MTFPDDEAAYGASSASPRRGDASPIAARRSSGRSGADAHACRLRRDEAVIRPAELIERKRNGGGARPPTSSTELVLGYARDEVPDYQMAALLHGRLLPRADAPRRRTRSPTR